MKHSMAKVTWGTVAAFVVGFIGGCAPTMTDDELTTTSAELSICGNGACDVGESCASCSGDCGRCTQAHCGDGTCGRRESCATCAADCGACPGCGNKVCDASETCASCSADCGRCGAEFCGNGTCGRRESCTACARDCCPGTGGGAGGGAGGGGGTGGGMASCTSASDCPATGSECVLAVCDNGQCSTTNELSGTLLVTQVLGDCHDLYCNGGGGTLELVNDADVPGDDGNECTEGVCTMGVASHDPLAAGTLCTGGTCDGAGTCEVACLVQNCPPTMNECTQPACVGNMCVEAFVPLSTPTTAQIAGDCLVQVCDGSGGTTALPDVTDPEDDGNACTWDFCQASSNVHQPEPAGTPCTLDGGVCDGMGSCL